MVSCVVVLRRRGRLLSRSIQPFELEIAVPATTGVPAGIPVDSDAREAASSPPGAVGVVGLPYLRGEKDPDPRPKGSRRLLWLQPNDDSRYLFRAGLEPTVCGFRHHLDVLAEVGVPRRGVRVTNGGARSQVWRQIVADVVEHPLEALRTRVGSAVRGTLRRRRRSRDFPGLGRSRGLCPACRDNRSPVRVGGTWIRTRATESFTPHSESLWS